MFILAGLAFLALTGQPRSTVFAVRSRLSLRACIVNRAFVPRYSKFELTLNLKANYDNPFDPDDIDVYCLFRSPSGKVVRVNGFIDQDYSRQLIENRDEKLTPAGDPVWKIRFAPDTVGDWTYVVNVKDRTGLLVNQRRSFQVGSSNDPGYIGLSTKSPGMFAFPAAGGKPFFALGENMCWAGTRGTYDFDKWLSELGRAGGNWIRIWMNNGNTTLEMMPEKSQPETVAFGYHGLGAYCLDHAWKLDQMLDTAEQDGIYTMLCFGTYGEFKTGGYFNEGQWNSNPYNAANGGPCKTAAEFWSSPIARKLYQQKLRYIAARYGYRTHIHSWEFWNEADPTADWTAEMSAYLKGAASYAGTAADPYHHLVSTTYGSDAVWKLPGVDFTMSHSYGTGNVADIAPVILDDAIAHRRYLKPHFMAEFGIDWRSGDEHYDTTGSGVNLHNGIWSGIATGDAGSAMLWYWDGYVSPKHVYGSFPAARKFVDSVPWTSAPWTRAQFDAVATPARAETFTDLALAATTGWGKSQNTEFTITQQGVLDSKPVTEFLYAPAKPDLRTVPQFHVQYARPGTFRFHVNNVSQSSHLKVSLDGVPVKEFELSASPPTGPSVKPDYESTQFVKEYGVYQAYFNRDYAIDVPTGRHTIALENTAGDWMSIESITLTNYRSSRYPELNLLGIENGKQAVIWAQNARHNWKNVKENKPIPRITGAITALRGLPKGRYTVEWWDTTSGAILQRNRVMSVGVPTSLTLKLPDISTDVAARVYPAAGP